MSFREKNEFVHTLAFFPALTVMVFIRKGVGFRLLRRGYIFGMGFGLWLVSVLSYNPRDPLPDAMQWFALAFVTVAFYQKIRRWLGLRRGASVHSYDTGVSAFIGKRTPHFLRSYWRVNRFVDPVCVVIVAFYVQRLVSEPLALWLYFSGACLLFFENTVYAKAFERDIDIADGLVSADMQSETVKHFQPPVSNDSHQADAAIPTGLGADIRSRTNRRSTLRDTLNGQYGAN